VLVNGREVDAWRANRDLPSLEPNGHTATRHTVKGLRLAPGDAIRVEGTADGKEGADFDYVELSPAGRPAQAAGKRLVVMQIELPDGAAPQLKVYEGQPASIELRDGQKFGFVPTPDASTNSTVVVSIFDLKTTPHRQLGEVEVNVGGGSVRSDTTPGFGIRVVEIQPAK